MHKKCFNIILPGLGKIKKTTPSGRRVVKNYMTKKAAERRVKVEVGRGWKPRIVKCMKK